MPWWLGRLRRGPEVQAEPAPLAPLELAGRAHVVSDGVDSFGYIPGTPDAELIRLVDAVRTVSRFLNGLGMQDAAYTEVLRTQNAILNDITWIRAATGDINKGAPAPLATLAAFGELSGLFDSIADATLKGRGTDVRSISRLVRSALVDAPLGRPEPAEPRVWIVDELDAATALQLRDDTCLGVVAISDLVSGHGLEIATARGFTCLTGREDAEGVSDGEQVRFN